MSTSVCFDSHLLYDFVHFKYNTIDICVDFSEFSGPASNVPPVYGLDVTDVTNWETTVLTPALEILKCLQKVWLSPLRTPLSSFVFLLYSSSPYFPGRAAVRAANQNRGSTQQAGSSHV